MTQDLPHVNPVGQVSEDTLKAVFCRRFGCPPEKFERAVLRLCFPPWVRPLGALLLALQPRTFRRELALIGRLGTTTNDSTVKPELEAYAYENQRDKSFRVRTLGLRLSRRRFIRMLQELRARGESESRPSVPGNADPMPPNSSAPSFPGTGSLAQRESVETPRF